MPALQFVIRYSSFVIRKKQNQPTTNEKRRTKNQLGFTLLELMIAISIIAIISAVGMVTYSQSQKLARDSKRKEDLKQIASALQLFYADNRRYPCSATADWQYSSQGTWITDASACTGVGGTGTKLDPLYINKVPIDPLSNAGSPNNAGVYGYAYFSWDAAWNGCSIGQMFILMTRLENSSDPDRIGSGSIPLCGTSLRSTTSNPVGPYDPGLFFITSQ